MGRKAKAKAKEQDQDLELEVDSAGPSVDELQERCAELEQRALRAQADYKNLRRRTLTDLEAGIRRSMQPLLDELLLVLDFLDMALASPATNDETKNLVQGVQMTRTKFVQALENSDVREVPTDGTFDPAVHDATDTRVTEDVEPGTIVAVARKGYTWQGTVLRPAQVVVAASAEGTTNAPDVDAGAEAGSGPKEDPGDQDRRDS